MKLKALLEKRSELLEKVEMENKSETRSTDKIDELLAEIETVNKDIEREERMAKVLDFKSAQKQVEKRDYNAEIRSAIEHGRELDVTNFEVEVEERTIGYGQGDKQTQNIAKKSFANAIIKKATDSSDLYKYVRTENVGTASHQIPVQKDKVGRFANVTELANYAEKNIDFTPINLSAHKFGNISVVSEEALADTGYNLMSELLEQYGESAGETLDYLLVKGDVVGVQGLESFSNNSVGQDGAVVQTIPSANIDTLGLDELLALYHAIPNKYRKNATWVISTELAARLNVTVDGVGRPLLTTDFSQVPFGGKEVPMLLGRPVVISDHVKPLTGSSQHDQLAFFGDLSKALVLGIRQNFTIKSSTEYAFIRDGVAIKGTMRLDAKRALGEALAVMVRGA